MPKLILNILIVTAILWLGVITFILIFGSRANIGFIDTQRLIAHQAQQIGASYPNQLSQKELQLLADKIKTTVANYAFEHKLILIAKNAICGGELIDYTSEIIALLRGDE